MFWFGSIIGATWSIITNLLPLLILFIFLFLSFFFFFCFLSFPIRSIRTFRRYFKKVEDSSRVSWFTRSDLISNQSLRFCVLIFRFDGGTGMICSRWRIYFSRAHLLFQHGVIHQLSLAFTRQFVSS